MSKEYYEVIAMFERSYKTVARSHRLDKEPKELWSMGQVYQDGELNVMFRIYLMGYSFGKSVQIEAEV